MDMKKKLEDAYLPDKGARREKVLLALSGSLDSMVAAYLLKLQKFDLIAVTVNVGWESFLGDPKDVLSCHIGEKNQDAIKQFCDQLGIPLHVVKSSGEFQEDVVEEWIAARLVARNNHACWHCHDLRMKILYQKMKDLGAQHLATGHYAKIFKNDIQGTAFVNSSNDEEFDQSHLLSRLPSEILKVLLLPLSDLQKKEVIKLGENFGVGSLDKKLKPFQCFPWNEALETYLKSKVPSRYLDGGSIVDDEERTLASHEGIFHYTLGAPVVVNDLSSEPKNFLGNIVISDKTIKVKPETFFMRSEVLINTCHLSDETSWDEPFKGFLRVKGQFYECWVQPKTLQSAMVSWEEKVMLLEGDILFIYRKKGKNSKVYISGKVRYLAAPPVVLEGDESVKIDHTRDF